MLNVLSGLSLLLLAAPQTTSDWPTYMADATRVGRTDQSPPGELSVRWTWTSSEAPRTAWPGPGGRTIERLKLEHRVRFDDAIQPIVADGRVFFGSSVDHYVRCLDLRTGEELWRFATGGAVRLAPTWSGGRTSAIVRHSAG